jgi:hypothetical protein
MYGMKTNGCHYFIRLLLDLYMFRAHRPIFRRVRTAVHTTNGSVSVPLCSRAPHTHSTRTERYRNWTNGCVNSCRNSPEDGPVGPKHVETQQYTNKIVTSVGLYSIYRFLFNSISRWSFWRMCCSCLTHKIKFTEINIKHCSWTGNSVFALF